MNKLKIFFILIVLFNINKQTHANVIEIKVKIQNEIITNLDIENEKRYLFFLNPRLQELEITKIDNIAKDSLITEIIKTKELEKFFNFNENKKLINIVEKNLFLKKNIKNKDEFLNILKKINLDYETIKIKLYIEALWNQFIFQKYSENVIINKNQLKNNILDQINKEEKKFSYNLSEIFFEESIDNNFDQTFSKINESIKEIGFENTANIYSTSNTSKKGGLIGWVNELQLSSKIRDQIKILDVNEITKPIKLNNGFILIKLNNKKEFNQKIDLDEQLKRLINSETNRQLNNFSNIHFKKLKKNLDIDAY